MTELNSASSTGLSQPVAYFDIPCSAVGYRDSLTGISRFVFYSGGLDGVSIGIEVALV